jgi:hypothetical protein
VFLFRDILAVAAAFVIRGYLLMPLIVLWVRRYASIEFGDQLRGLRGPAIATAVMAAAVLAVKFALIGHVPSWLLLLAEVAAGMVTFLVALVVVDRSVLRDVLGIALQAIPGGRRVAKMLHLPMPPSGSLRIRSRTPPEETVTSGTSVGAESRTAGGTPSDEDLGDV